MSSVCRAQNGKVPIPFGGYGYSYWATLNPLDKGSDILLTGGYLTAHQAGGYDQVRATIGVSATSANPRVYWEVYVNSYSSGAGLGISNRGESANTNVGQTTNGWGFILSNVGLTPTYWHGGSGPGYGAVYTAGQYVRFALDMVAGTLTCYINNTSYGTMASGITGTVYPSISTFGGNPFNYTVNFGATAWAYTPPTGFVGLHH